MVTVFVFPFFSVTFAFTVAFPAFFAVIFPFLETVATDLSVVVYAMLFTLAVLSLLLSSNSFDAPFLIVNALFFA
jgi:hypothetical protein